MTDDGSSGTAALLVRLRDATRELLARRNREGRATAEEQDAERGGEALDKATRLLSGTFERLRQASGVARFLRPSGRDQVVGVGEHYELVVQLGTIGGQLAHGVRFVTGDEELGRAELIGGTAWLDPQAHEPGLMRVEHEVLGPRDVVLRGRDPDKSFRIQVVDDAPTVAVDAGLLLEPGAARGAASLGRLADAGCVLFYVDLAQEERTEAIRQAIEAYGLPDGALLSHPLAEAEFRTLGVDFREVFAVTALRRVRAHGVPLVALVTGDREVWRVCERDGVDSLDPRAVDELLEGDGVESLRARARELAEHWRSSAPLDFRLDSMTGTRAVDGHRCHVELDNRLARQTLFHAIDGAAATVHASFYIFEEGSFTEHLCVRLIAAARRGVRVRLLVDALYSREAVLGLRNPIVEGLRAEPGIDVLASDPIPDTEHLDPLALKQRDHRKLIVVDGSRAFVSGRNAGDEYYTGFDEVPITDFTSHERIPWLDAHIELQGPLVTEVERAFLDAWSRNGGEAPEPASECAPAGSSRARFVMHEGARDANGLGAYEAMLDAAQSHVFLVNDYPVVSSLAAAVRRALGRGVRVVMLTGNAVARRSDGSFFRGPLYREMFEYMTKRRLETLMQLGVELYEYTTEPSPLVVARGGVIRPYVHAKLVTADGRVASVGSANLDATASYWEREANVAVEDPQVVEPLEARLRAIVARSHRIEPDSGYWRAESGLRDIVSRLWPDSLYS